MDKSQATSLLKSPKGLEFLSSSFYDALLVYFSLGVEASFDSVSDMKDLRQLQGKEKLISQMRALPSALSSIAEKEKNPPQKAEPAFAGDRR